MVDFPKCIKVNKFKNTVISAYHWQPILCRFIYTFRGVLQKITQPDTPSRSFDQKTLPLLFRLDAFNRVNHMEKSCYIVGSYIILTILYI